VRIFRCGRRGALAILFSAGLTAGLIAGSGTAAAADPVRQDDPSNTWVADLTAIDADDTNVTFADGRLQIADPSRSPASLRLPVPEGMLTLAGHPLATPADTVTVTLSGKNTGVTIEARGLQSDGEWGEWREAGATLSEPTLLVQIRVVLTGVGASIADLALTAVLSASPRIQAATPGLTYRVFATREGLVGGTTANGHVIASRDHFVALPSRRGLATKNTGDYTVKVCTTSGTLRCEYAPVWDVGPWNTTDDNWNPAATRQSWKDLPQGRPEAQAAYQSDYNGGEDQFGRQVANPAGIDLADGTFWDGLKLADNSWVNVSYLWTGTGSRATIGSGNLNIRTSPNTSAASMGYVSNYARVPVECFTTGTTVTGTYRTTNQWDRLASGQFISHAYVASVTGGTVSAC
jgi:hypothetical protein